MSETYPKPDPISPYFGHENVDRWGKVVTELLSEVWALNQRVRRLESTLTAQGISLAEDEEPGDAHLERRAAFLRRSFWPFLEEAADAH